MNNHILNILLISIYGPFAFIGGLLIVSGLCAPPIFQTAPIYLGIFFILFPPAFTIFVLFVKKLLNPWIEDD